MQRRRLDGPWNDRGAQVRMGKGARERHAQDCTRDNRADKVLGEIGLVLVIILASAATMHIVVMSFHIG